MAKAKKTADAATAQAGSTEGSDKERSFPHPFGSQDAQKKTHMLRLVLNHFRRQEEAFTDETARAALETLANVLLAQGKNGVYMIMDVAQETGLALQKIEMLSVKMVKTYKKDWPSNKDQVKAFIDTNAKTIKALEGKTEFDALK